MGVVKVRLRCDPMDAWQYVPGTPVIRWPGWVMQNTKYTDAGLVLNRRSGFQVVSPGDWIVRKHDHKDLLWYSDFDFRKDLEII